jgi:hypothetical protein
VALWWNNLLVYGMNREWPVVERRPVRARSESLRLTVVFTTVPGTVAALGRAVRLAQDLGLSLTLLIPQVVPYQVPITCPPVAIEHTRQMALSLISASSLGAYDVAVQICLCRDRLECLRRLISARSIVFLGGRNSWWPGPEQKLGKALRALDCDVIFVDQEEYRHA